MIYGCRQSDSAPVLVPPWTTVGLADPAETVDLRQYATYVSDQGQKQKCVGAGLSGGMWIANRGQGQRASDTGIWRGALVRERLRKTDPITNIGCMPHDALDGLVSVGCYPRDEVDDDPSDSVAPETWPEAYKSKLCTPDMFALIDMGDVDTVKRWLSAGFGVCFGMPVDDSYEQLKSWDVWPGLSGTPKGGHYQCSIGYDATSLWVWGSWSVRFGQNGFVRIAWDFIRGGAFDLVCVKGAPIL